jgi:hypothetical protein
MSTAVSEEHVDSIFRVEEQGEEETSMKNYAARRVTLFFDPEYGNDLFPPKRRLTTSELQSALSQKI